MIRIICCILACYSVLGYISGQASHIKWGKVPTSDLKMLTYEEDSSAAAVILADLGILSIYSIGDFEYRLHHHRRVKILKRTGFNVGDIFIPIAQDFESIKKLKAQVIKPSGEIIKLSKKDIFEDKLSSKVGVIKFAFPQLEPGAIIEYRYDLISTNFFNPRTWWFQHDIPVKYSKLEVLNNTVFDYISLFEGAEYMDKKHFPDGRSVFSSGNTKITVSGGKYIMENGVAIKEEPFITVPEDYRARIRFQLNNTKYGGQDSEIISTWPDFAKFLLSSGFFGGALKNKSMLQNLVSSFEAKFNPKTGNNALLIYNFIKSTFKWNGHYDYGLKTSIKDISERKIGSSGEINLLLLALLKQYGIEAYPILTSTRSHGKMTKEYPFAEQFNHVLVVAKIGSSYIYMDAIDPSLPMGLVHKNALNREGFLVDKNTSQWIEISPPRDEQIIKTHILLNENGTITGQLDGQYNAYSAIDLQKKIKENKNKNFWKDLVGDNSIDSLKVEHSAATTTTLSFNLNFQNTNNGIGNKEHLYLPIFSFLPSIENPFKHNNRYYPVDYPYPFSRFYLTNITIPEGYEVEELPKDSKLELPEKSGLFTFSAHQHENTLQVYYKFEINKLRFNPSEYPSLKLLYEQMIDKLEEQLVLKRVTKKDN